MFIVEAFYSPSTLVGETMATDVNMLTILKGFFVLWALWTFTTIIWSVFFSKLSRLPGPKFAAVTRFMLIHHKLKGDAEWWRRDLHRKYGIVVRVAPNEVSIASGEGWKEIYGLAAKGTNKVKYAKDPFFYQQSGKSMVVASETDHSRQRRSFSHAFSEQALRAQEPLIKTHVSQLLTNLNDAADSGTPIDLCKQYNFAAFDIMADLTWGEVLDCLKNSEYVPWISMVFDALKVITIIGEINYYPKLRRWMDACIPNSLREKQKQHLQFSADRVDRRLENTMTSRPDIWTFVLAAKEDFQLTLDEMHANAGLFMIAGSEPIGTLLSALTFFLLSNPQTMLQLKSELRAAFQTTDDITAQGLGKLKYLNAAIQEAFRLHPPVPIGLPRTVPSVGAYICGHEMPAGTSIYVHHLSTYHNPCNFVSPDDFLPQRWLSSDSTRDEAFSSDIKTCLQPFTIGPRACIGSNLAYLEIRLILAHVLLRFDLELCEESMVWNQQRVFSMWETKPLMVKCIAIP